MQYEDLLVYHQNLKCASNDKSKKLLQRYNTLEDQKRKKQLVIKDLLRHQHQIHQSSDVSSNELARKNHEIQALRKRLDEIDEYAVNVEKSERLRMQYEDLLVHDNQLKSTNSDECEEPIQQNNKLQDQNRKHHLVITDLLKNQHEIYNSSESTE